MHPPTMLRASCPLPRSRPRPSTLLDASIARYSLPDPPAGGTDASPPHEVAVAREIAGGLRGDVDGGERGNWASPGSPAYVTRTKPPPSDLGCVTLDTAAFGRRAIDLGRGSYEGATYLAGRHRAHGGAASFYRQSGCGGEGLAKPLEDGSSSPDYLIRERNSI